LVRRPAFFNDNLGVLVAYKVIGRSFRVGGVSGLCKHLEEIERMTIRDIQAHLERALGTVLSHHTISNNIEAVAEEGQGAAGPPVGERADSIGRRKFIVVLVGVTSSQDLIRCLVYQAEWGRSLSSAAMSASWPALQRLRSLPSCIDGAAR